MSAIFCGGMLSLIFLTIFLLVVGWILAGWFGVIVAILLILAIWAGVLTSNEWRASL